MAELRTSIHVPRLVESLRNAPLVNLSGYDYFVHPLTDGVPDVPADLLRETVHALQARLPETFDRFLAPEAMGLPLATGLTMATGKSFLCARKRRYGLAGEVEVPYQTGYATGTLYLNGIRKGERLVLVDDVASRGGTLRALASAVPRLGARIERVLLVVNKGLDLDALSKELGAPVEALVDVAVQDGRVIVNERP